MGVAQSSASNAATRNVCFVASLISPRVRMSPRLSSIASLASSTLIVTAGANPCKTEQPPNSQDVPKNSANRRWRDVQVIGAEIRKLIV